MPGYFSSPFGDDETTGFFGGYRPRSMNPLGASADSGELGTDDGSNANVAEVAYKGPGTLSPQQQAQNLTRARDAESNPEVFAFMQALADGESNGDYHSIYDGSATGSQFAGWNYPGHAAGAYQITRDTYYDLQKQLGLTDFSPDTQDAMAAHLIVKGGALPYLLKSDLQGAVERLRGTWASLPGAGKQSHTDMDTFRARYNRYLNALNGAQP